MKRDSQRNPFIAGRWVVGDHFIGRGSLIKELVDSHETCHWVIGKRRIGKTSLLRQIEHLCCVGEDRFAIFWDIQGSYDTKGMRDSLQDAIEDHQDVYPACWKGLDFNVDETLSCHQTIKRLARSAHSRFSQLILLIDEAEELINIGRHDIEALSKLRRVLHHTRGLRTVLCSTPRLEQLHQLTNLETSPFLHGFQSRFLGNLGPGEPDQLLSRGIPSQHTRDEVFTLTEGNPFETQLLAKHLFENPDIESVCAEMEASPTLQQVIDVNFDLLDPVDQNVLKDVYCGRSALSSYPSGRERNRISRLESMGYLSVLTDQIVSVSSHFLRKWLELKFEGSPAFHAQHQSDMHIGPQHSNQILKQLPALYRFFLETTSEGKRIANLGRGFRISGQDGTIYPDLSNMVFEEDERAHTSWIGAIRETARLIETTISTDESWTLHRFLTMSRDTAEPYSETDFLDLMMLISEEAELERH